MKIILGETGGFLMGNDCRDDHYTKVEKNILKKELMMTRETEMNIKPNIIVNSEGYYEIEFDEEYLPISLGCIYRDKKSRVSDKVVEIEQDKGSVIITYRPYNSIETGIGHIDLAVSLEDFVKSHEMLKYADFDN